MNKMMVSDVVKTLEKRNLLTRKPHPEDGRAMSLHLTASAREKLKKAVPAVGSADEEFLKKLNTKNRERFIDVIHAQDARGTCSLTQMGDSYRCRANSPESMT